MSDQVFSRWRTTVKKLSLALEYCYGIRKLQAELIYSDSSTIAIYAPNGAMKSSLANTFQDIAVGATSKDMIFPTRTTYREIRDELGKNIDPSSILVLRPYEDSAGTRSETATLLVNQELRAKYEELHSGVNSARKALFDALKDLTKTKADIPRAISMAFTNSEDKVDVALNQIQKEIETQKEAPFANVPYELIMDEKVQAFLTSGDSRTAIDDYVKKYNELISASRYFKKGTFNYYNAENISKQLRDNGFFKAKHIVKLNAEESIEIRNEAELDELIKTEKEKITNDTDLRKKFSVLEKQLHKNEKLREFEAYLQNNETLLPELGNLPEFRKKLWKSYIKTNYELYVTLLEKLKKAERETKFIVDQAEQERTLWQTVIDIFNDRFSVPFRLEVANKAQVVLGCESAPKLVFVFKEGNDEQTVDREVLLQALSTGEKKAFYILNILFDIEVRRQSGNETLIVVDDIADSFDYKNKYAIVQYLIDLAADQKFKLLILTHNFDFFRTIESRHLVQRRNCLMVFKTSNDVNLEQAVGIKNIFVNVWKKGFYTDKKKKICCIPFMRNLIEFTKDDDDPDFLILTSLLHWKKDSNKITIADLDGVYGRLFPSAENQSENGGDYVLDIIESEAKTCLHAPEGLNFENKVVLSIAIRLIAEKHMVYKINDANFVNSINGNQTPELMARYRRNFTEEYEKIRVLQKVILMTPENIHLNSFMYEPILDISDFHLRDLYSEVLTL
jgi:hypothetical protein